MIERGSTGGTSHGSGNPPVYSPEALAERLHREDITACSEEQAAFFIETLGFNAIVPYLDFLVRDESSQMKRPVETLADIIEFDSGVRMLLLKGVELLELQLKAQYQKAMYMVGGELCLHDESLFRNEKERLHTMSVLNAEALRQARTNSAVRKSFANGDGRLPVWTAMDVASFGTVRRLYSNTRDATVVHRVAESFGVNHRCLHSWLRTLSLVRNCCAHFNPYVVRPQVPAVPKPVHGVEGDNSSPLYALALVDRLMSGRAETVGGTAMRDCEQFKEQAEELLGAFAWRHPELAVALGMPAAYADAYADGLLPALARSQGPRALSYRLVALAA